MSEAVELAISHDAYERHVVDLARTLGYARYHTLRSIGSEYGYPDDMLLDPLRARLIVIEIKTEKDPLRHSQEWWLSSFRLAGVPSYCLRPRHWPAVGRLLGVHASICDTDEERALFVELVTTGGYVHRLTDAEMALGPRGVAELHGEIKPKRRYRR